jgi:mRNA-degrading endonuclease RelE of RelBE toxin-antitoxin system
VATVRATAKFQKQAGKLMKKYASLVEELANLETLLAEKPDYGIPLGKNCFKIRLAVKSKGKGKRSGLRIITHLIFSFMPENGASDDTIYLVVPEKRASKTIAERRQKAISE